MFVWMLAMASVSFAQAAPQAIHGVIVRLEGTQLRVRTNGGTERAIAVGDDTRVIVQSAATADSIQPGDFVATTAAPQADGTLRASELRIFSESLRGVGEGHRPMSNLPGSTMTNATVTTVSASSTTNATVATVGARSGERIIKVTYPGGTQTVVVPPGIPVSRIDVGDRTALAPGAHVVVRGAPNANGELAASRISVGKGGFVPPS
jgi:hypothetical protein